MSALKEQKQGYGSIKVSANRWISVMTREIRTFEHLNVECRSLFWFLLRYSIVLLFLLIDFG